MPGTLLTKTKNAFVPSGTAPRTIKFGLFAGLSMMMSLHNRMQLYLGLWEREVHPWLSKFSSRIKIAVDIGAAEGTYTLFFLAKTSTEKVFSFEPMTDKHAAFKRNLELNSLALDDRLELSSKFVGSCDSDRIITLNTLLSGLDDSCLIKVDVDGGEVDVLRGAEKAMQQSHLHWIIETHSQDLERDCIDKLTKHDYATVIVPNAWWRCILTDHRISEHNRWLVAWQSGDIS